MMRGTFLSVPQNFLDNYFPNDLEIARLIIF
jgi:hypothetical protein